MGAKEKLFNVLDRIQAIKNTPVELTEKEKNELANLEVKKMRFYSEWKDDV